MGLAPIYIPAAIAAANLHYQTYAADKSEKTQGRRQDAAQRSAESSAVSQQRRSEEAYNRANRKLPDITSILTGEQDTGGLGSSLLSGPSGVDPNSVRLNRKTLLGG